MKIEVKFDGLDSFLNRNGTMPAALVKGVAKTLYEEGERVMTIAKENYVPVDTGNLRASGYVDQPDYSVGGVTVELGFGGPAGGGNVDGDSNTQDVGYAVYVHEDLSKHHTVGQAKYLETPIMDEQANIQQAVEDTARQVLKIDA